MRRDCHHKIGYDIAGQVAGGEETITTDDDKGERPAAEMNDSFEHPRDVTETIGVTEKRRAVIAADNPVSQEHPRDVTERKGLTEKNCVKNPPTLL